MKAVYKLHFDCGRNGMLYGLFISEKDQVEKLIESKREVCFGEVLGYHSEVYGPIDKSDITLVTDDPEIVKLFEKHDLQFGFNPFDYLDELDEMDN